MLSLTWLLLVATLTSAASSVVDVARHASQKDQQRNSKESDDKEADENVNSAKVTRHLLRSEKTNSDDKRDQHAQRAAAALPIVQDKRNRETRERFGGLSGARVAHLEKLASNASEGELIEGLVQRDVSSSSGEDEDDQAEDVFESKRKLVDSSEDRDDDAEEKDGRRRDVDEEEIEDARLKRLNEKLAAAEQKNNELQRIAQVAAQAAFQAARARMNTTETKTQLKHQAALPSASLQDMNATSVQVLPSMDEDPSREFADRQRHGNSTTVQLTNDAEGKRKRIQLGDKVPGVAQLVETMATLSASEILRLEHEHRLDDTVQEDAAAAAAVEARRSARRLKMMSSASAVPIPAGDPEKPREVRVGRYQLQKLCLTHNTLDHSTELAKCESSVHQNWYFHSEKLKVMNSSRCLAVQMPNPQARRRRRRVGRIVLQACDDVPNQKFYLDGMALKSKANDTTCATVAGDMSITMDTCKTEDNQDFFRHPPRDCLWGEWGRWAACTATCGGGRQRRERKIVFEAEPKGAQCVGDDFEIGVCSKVGCPIACEWGDWMAWEECTMSCGGGQKTKKRTKRVKAANGGRQCNGQPFQMISCNTEPCPVDCAWGLWEEWADCTKTCGGGIMRRDRGILSHAMYGGKPCPAVGTFALEGASLVTDASVIVSTRGGLGTWSTCRPGYHAMGIGTFQLMDQVANDAQNLLDFECKPDQNGCRAYCQGSDCKLATRCASMGDGKTKLGTFVTSRADEWGPFSECPDQYSVFGFAKLSMLEAHKTNANVNDFHCNATGCRAWCQRTGCEYQSMCGSKVNVVNGRHVKGEADTWSPRSSCPKNMMVVGLSQVTLLQPSEGLENLNRWDCNEDGCRAWCWGSDCTVVSRCMNANAVAGVYEEAHCAWSPCPIDCQLGEWQSWTSCTQSCGGGLKSRERIPVVTPENGGTPCGYLGLAVERSVCNAAPCPIDCVWSQWGEWDDCAVSCGGGQRVRHRMVARTPKNNGKACKGVFELVDVCGTTGCPVDCKYAMWSGWDACSKTCGGDGFRRRNREIAIEVRSGGKMCTGLTTEIDESCGDKPCPVDCVLDQWTTWSTCSVPCGLGVKTRFRLHTVPRMYGGKACSGAMSERGKCTERPCRDGENV